MSLAYTASWATRVKVLTALVTAILAGEAILVSVIAACRPQISPLLVPLRWAFLAVLGLTALFTVRGYSLENGYLKVRRLFWTTDISLDGLSRVTRRPGALRITVKGYGNGGLFAILGWRFVDGVGWCRAFATNPGSPVILECDAGNYIVTPDDPESFVEDARQWIAR